MNTITVKEIIGPITNIEVKPEVISVSGNILTLYIKKMKFGAIYKVKVNDFLFCLLKDPNNNILKIIVEDKDKNE